MQIPWLDTLAWSHMDEPKGWADPAPTASPHRHPTRDRPGSAARAHGCCPPCMYFTPTRNLMLRYSDTRLIQVVDGWAAVDGRKWRGAPGDPAASRELWADAARIYAVGGALRQVRCMSGKLLVRIRISIDERRQDSGSDDWGRSGLN